MHSALVPLDGSPHSEMALEEAISCVKDRDVKLVGMGVIDEPTITSGEAIPLGATYFKKEKEDVLLKDANDTIQAFLGKFTEKCDAAGVPNHSVVSRGEPFDEICRESHRHDMIFMGCQSHFHFETQVAPDDVFRWIVRDSPRPVVAVPKKLRESRRQRVLVAYDGSLQSARAMHMHHLLRLFLTGDCEVDVLSVDKTLHRAAYLNRHAMDFYQKRGLKANAIPIGTDAKPEEVILQQVEELNPALLVMGAFGTPILKELFFGSVTAAVLRDSTVPLFVFD